MKIAYAADIAAEEIIIRTRAEFLYLPALPAAVGGLLCDDELPPSHAS